MPVRVRETILIGVVLPPVPGVLVVRIGANYFSKMARWF